jgi:hypothetical protein
VKTFRAIVKEAFVNTVRKSDDPNAYPAVLAEELRELFRANGYAVHAEGGCTRIPSSVRELGRPMEEWEMRAVGILPETGTGDASEETPPAEGDPGHGSTEDRTVSAVAKEGDRS